MMSKVNGLNIQVIKYGHSGVRYMLFACIAVIATAYIYAYASDPYIRFSAIVLLLIASELMACYWVNRFTGGVIDSIAVIFKHKKSLWNADFPEYHLIADSLGVKLNRKRPFGIQENLDNAYANPFSRQVILGEKLLNRLNAQEKAALVTHELQHLRQNPLIGIWLTMAAINIISITLPQTLVPSIITRLVAGSVSVLIFVLIAWRREYNSDQMAARIVGAEATISLLQKLAPEDEKRLDSGTHPSVSNRIKRIVNNHYR